MPELPEVETVVRTLEYLIGGLRITDIDVLYPPIVSGNVNAFSSALINKRFTGFSRRGKYALYTLEDIVLMVHLRMEGRFYVLDHNAPIDKHTHLIFHLENGKQLHYNDVRKFGRLEVLLPQDIDSRLAALGLEPFDKKLTGHYLRKMAQKRDIGLKTFLLDQRFVAGIGNIYADEICFCARLHPETNVRKISLKRFNELANCIKMIMSQAIADGGTTIRSYTSSLGVSGRFQLNLNVHMRKGEACRSCGQTIIKTRVSGRGTYLCLRCQKRIAD
ncbi:MAG: bifunctional DNA-formamidopyrimidine glycosylase/DNA-(apurinic or apyrimidinic site) lyase [Erysipelothrix sp.]|nr:bifunctional DNA-formamidopyrimidine glycosylase/DNA-(apurinic or apyrimidinic site) lyase [Erysipelothrix sp.]